MKVLYKVGSTIQLLTILVSVAVPALGWSTPGVVMIVWLQSRDRHPQLEDGEGGSICKGWEWWGD